MKKANWFVVAMVIASCGNKATKEIPFDSAAYYTEVDAWHKKRVEDLKGPKGWLNIAGLYWLKEGVNTFGSSKESDIVFPDGKIEPKAGVFILNQGQVTIKVSPGVTVISGDRPVASRVVYPPDSNQVILMK